MVVIWKKVYQFQVTHLTAPLLVKVQIYLKIMRHGILHYLWSANLLVNLLKLSSILYVNIYFFSITSSIDRKVWGYPTLLTPWFINFNVRFLFDWLLDISAHRKWIVWRKLYFLHWIYISFILQVFLVCFSCVEKLFSSTSYTC